MAVRVEGLAADAAQRTMRQHLAGVAHVDVSLTTGTPLGARTETHPDLTRWLARTYGVDPRVKRAFVPDLLAGVARVRERLAAMQALAKRYTGPAGVRWSAATRSRLQQLVDAHYAALTTDLATVDKDLAILFGSTGRCVPLSSAPVDWAQRARVGEPLALRVEQRVQALMRLDDLSPADEHAHASTIGPPFNALWNVVNDIGRPRSR